MGVLFCLLKINGSLLDIKISKDKIKNRLIEQLSDAKYVIKVAPCVLQLQNIIQRITIKK